MPTGTAMRDARQQLFDAAERVLLRDGPSVPLVVPVTTRLAVPRGSCTGTSLTSMGFLAELVLDRISRIGDQADALCRSAGTGSVVANLTEVLNGAVRVGRARHRRPRDLPG